MKIELLGVAFDNVSMAEATAQGETFLNGEGTHYVVTPNPEIVEVCRENPQAMAAVNGASLVLPDGIGVIYGAKINHTPLKERVPGIEFGTAMIEACARMGLKVYFFGAKPGVAAEAAVKMQERYPALQVAGSHDGYFKEEESESIALEIRQSGAALVFVCLGAPKQELWMQKYGEKTGAKLLLGLGGSLNVFAGVAKRAPQFFCDHNLEWFYRLVKEPSRIGRMMKLPLFLIHVKGAKKK